MGLPTLDRLCEALGSAAVVWPFDGGFAAPLAPVCLAEIYPSLFAVPSDAAPGSISLELGQSMPDPSQEVFDAFDGLEKGRSPVSEDMNPDDALRRALGDE